MSISKWSSGFAQAAGAYCIRQTMRQDCFFAPNKTSNVHKKEQHLLRFHSAMYWDAVGLRHMSWRGDGWYCRNWCIHLVFSPRKHLRWLRYLGFIDLLPRFSTCSRLPVAEPARRMCLSCWGWGTVIDRGLSFKQINKITTPIAAACSSFSSIISAMYQTHWNCYFEMNKFGKKQQSIRNLLSCFEHVRDGEYDSVKTEYFLVTASIQTGLRGISNISVLRQTKHWLRFEGNKKKYKIKLNIEKRNRLNLRRSFGFEACK